MPIDGTSETGLRRIRLGMVGGGRDAFIGAVHRIASRIDDNCELVAGCFSSSAEKSQASGADLGLDRKRVYDGFLSMAKREARLTAGVEAVAIAIRAAASGASVPQEVMYPDVHDGFAGVAFVAACVRSSSRNAAWVPFAA